MTPLALGIGSSPVHTQPSGLRFRYAPGITAASLGATYSGAGPRTYIDQNGILQTITGLREWVHYINGVPTTLLEPQRTNSFLNSGAPATHTSPSLGAGTYTLWLVGTGSIAVAAGTATITGAGTATSAAPVTFTVTVAGTVTFTVTGAPTRAQCENAAYASSYIATAGAAVTRSADSLSFPFAPLPQELTGYASYFDLGDSATPSTGYMWSLTNFSASIPSLRQATDGAGRVVAALSGSPSGLAGVAAPFGSAVETRLVLQADSSLFAGQSLAGAAETVGTLLAASAMPAAWSAPTLWLGAYGGNAGAPIAFRSFKLALGARDLPTMRVV